MAPPLLPPPQLEVPATLSRGRVVLDVLGVLVFRFACVAVMIWLALWAEARPAPTVPDFLISRVPYVQWVDRLNYVTWVLAYIPMVAVLLFRDVRRFCRYMVTAGLLAVVRGLCIAATGLGPVRGADINAGMTHATRMDAFAQLALPLSGLFHHLRPLYLTKDLFFSGHTSTTFCLLLYVLRFPRLRVWMLVAHSVVMLTVVFAHLHYTIDIIGAYAITFALYVVRESNLKQVLWGEPG